MTPEDIADLMSEDIRINNGIRVTEEDRVDRVVSEAAGKILRNEEIVTYAKSMDREAELTVPLVEFKHDPNKNMRIFSPGAFEFDLQQRMLYERAPSRVSLRNAGGLIDPPTRPPSVVPGAEGIYVRSGGSFRKVNDTPRDARVSKSVSPQKLGVVGRRRLAI